MRTSSTGPAAGHEALMMESGSKEGSDTKTHQYLVVFQPITAPLATGVQVA